MLGTHEKNNKKKKKKKQAETELIGIDFIFVLEI